MKQTIFVKLDEYNEIMRLVGLIKDKIEEAKGAVVAIKELKHNEDAELDLWRANLQEIEKKLMSVNRTFSEPLHTGE